MKNLTRIPRVVNPKLSDKVIDGFQTSLGDNIPWLDYVFGRAQTLIKKVKSSYVKYPAVYIKKNEYQPTEPDSGLGNFCFFKIDDDTDIDFNMGQSNKHMVPFDLIIWFNTDNIIEGENTPQSSVENIILNHITNDMFIPYGNVIISNISRSASDVFSGYDIKESDSQFFMHPYSGLRISGTFQMYD